MKLLDGCQLCNRCNKQLVDARGRWEVGGGSDANAYALKAVRPKKATALFAWYLGAFAAELAAFAVASATLHPIVIVPGYMLGAVANTAAAWWGGSEDFLFVAARSCITVSVAMAGNHTKSFPAQQFISGTGPWLHSSRFDSSPFHHLGRPLLPRSPAGPCSLRLAGAAHGPPGAPRKIPGAGRRLLGSLAMFHVKILDIRRAGRQ